MNDEFGFGQRRWGHAVFAASPALVIFRCRHLRIAALRTGRCLWAFRHQEPHAVFSMPATKLRQWHTCLLLRQNRDHLVFAEPAALHSSLVSSRQTQSKTGHIPGCTSHAVSAIIT